MILNVIVWVLLGLGFAYALRCSEALRRGKEGEGIAGALIGMILVLIAIALRMP